MDFVNPYRVPGDGMAEHSAPRKVRRKMFARTRVQYTSRVLGLVVAEPGDEIVEPDEWDLRDMIEHDCVVS